MIKMDAASKPALAPKCRRNHPKFGKSRWSCPDCRTRDQSVTAIRDWEIKHGVYNNDLVDPGPAREHATELLRGGWTRESMAEACGVGYATVQRIIRGDRKKISRTTSEAILSLEPKPYAIEAARGCRNGIGAARKLQGLQAQGFTGTYLASLAGIHHSRIGQISQLRRGPFLKQETIDQVNNLADKLGEFDIAELDEPMPGMSIITAQRAARAGWRVLADWYGLDIDDPRVRPHGSEETPAALIDPAVVGRALDISDPGGFDDLGHHIEVEVAPLGMPFSRAEAYEIVRRGSRPKRDGTPKLSSNVLGQRLQLCERTVIRMRADNRAVDAVVYGYPGIPAALHVVASVISAAEWSAVFRMKAVALILAAYPLDRSFRSRLIILRFTQPQPYGRGWSDTELSAWLGITPEEAADVRHRAERAASQQQKTNAVADPHLEPVSQMQKAA